MNDEADRLISPDKRGEDLDAALRPQTLDDFSKRHGFECVNAIAREFQIHVFIGEAVECREEFWLRCAGQSQGIN